ncbi:hypothetical protein Q4I32_000764 [Leishmania shawi]|uniref:Phosphoglycan beta 1,3 galactosyltransferase n=1 Tax=Leishmania shawi TaxID=5680 RepID=A0AAW3C894_9TRYP
MMEDEFVSNVIKRRCNAVGTGAGRLSLPSLTTHERSAGLLRSDGYAGEGANQPQERLKSASEPTVNSSATPLLAFHGHVRPSNSLEQHLRASTSPNALGPYANTPGVTGGAARLWHRLLHYRAWKHRLGRRGVAVTVATCVLFLLLSVSLICVLGRRSPPKRLLSAATRKLMEEMRGWTQGISVLVQHEGAVERLNLTAAQCGSIVGSALDGAGETHRLSAHMLPSWTLHVVEKGCADCTDQQTYASAVEGVVLQARHAVFATSAAPLGRVGPMLLAMASVTDDVDVRAELPQWEWLRHVHGSGFPAVGGAAGVSAPPRAPYLAVMGIPSTDQRPRAALREAQRKTWLAYQEVARRDNHFTGALLALYVFAAAEPMVPVDLASDEQTRSATMKGYAQDNASSTLFHHTTALLPSLREYDAASCVLATGNTTGDCVAEDFAPRRVVLRRGWKSADIPSPPCDRVLRTSGSSEGAPTSALSYLSDALSLPVTPAFTSPAEYICHASSALWQEALTHRNVLWIDMMTDRRPTTNKKLGEAKNWGLPVEVGMSQKLILWLAYAYHAFKDVPFIIKGDDDAYVKVPQFLSDVRYVMGGMQARPPPPPLRQTDTAVMGSTAITQATVWEGEMPLYRLPSVPETKCFYWGSSRRMLDVRFNAGMMFLLHRRLVQIILERPQRSADVDLALLAVQEFSEVLKPLYRQSGLQHEDVMIGVTLRRRYKRARRLCADRTIWYVKESYARFHDMHHGRLRAVTWSTVVAHRCRPVDAYFLHYYFQQEHIASTLETPYGGGDQKEMAIEAAAEWMSKQSSAFAGTVAGLDKLPLVVWTHNVSAGPGYVIAHDDGVAVYSYSYEYWKDSATLTFNGYRSTS